VAGHRSGNHPPPYLLIGQEELRRERTENLRGKEEEEGE